MKYLMFVYGESDEMSSDEVTTKIAKELQPVTLSNSQIKFVYGNGNAIFHFNSELKFTEMSIYSDILIKDFEDFMYVLIPFDGEISSNAGDERVKHLMDLEETDVKNFKTKHIDDFTNFVNNEDVIYDVFINLMNNGDYFYNTQKKKNDICEMTLDELLDKILDKGINSLTDIERKKLEEYSK